MTRKRLIALVVFGGLFIGAGILFNLFPTTVNRSYNHVTTTTDGVEIYFDVYEPVGGTNPKTAIILGHGFMVNKEVMKLLAVDLASSGFLVVAFDFRSHGTSGGDFNFMADTFDLDDFSIDYLLSLVSSGVLTRDIAAMKQYLQDRGDVDMDNLGYVGYSMGGGAGIAALANDTDYRAMVGLAPAPDVVHTNLTRPQNLLVVVGKQDEAIPYDTLLKVLENKTNKTVTADMINANVTLSPTSTWEWELGSFAAGTAARLYVDPLAEHFLAAWNLNFIREIKSWFLRALMSISTPPETFTYGPLVLLLVLQIIGGVGFFFTIAGPLIDKFGRKNESPVIAPQYFEELSPSKLIIGVSIFVVLLSFPCMLLILPVFFTPQLMTTLQLMLLLGPSFAVLLYLKQLTHRKVKIRQIYRDLFRATNKRNVLVGFGLGILFYLILLGSIGQILSLVPALGKWPWVPLYFLVALFCFANFIMLFQGVLQERMVRKHSNFLPLVKHALLNFALTIVTMTYVLLVPCLLLENYFIMMFFIPMVPLLLAASFMGTLFYARSRDNLIPSIAAATQICMLMCTLSPILYVWLFF